MKTKNSSETKNTIISVLNSLIIFPKFYLDIYLMLIYLFGTIMISILFYVIFYYLISFIKIIFDQTHILIYGRPLNSCAKFEYFYSFPNFFIHITGFVHEFRVGESIVPRKLFKEYYIQKKKLINMFSEFYSFS